MSPQCREVKPISLDCLRKCNWLHCQPLKHFGLLKWLFFKVHESFGSRVYCFRSVILRRFEGLKMRFLKCLVSLVSSRLLSLLVSSSLVLSLLVSSCLPSSLVVSYLVQSRLLSTHLVSCLVQARFVSSLLVSSSCLLSSQVSSRLCLVSNPVVSSRLFSFRLVLSRHVSCRLFLSSLLSSEFYFC